MNTAERQNTGHINLNMMGFHRWNKGHIWNLSFQYGKSCFHFSKPHKLRSWPKINGEFNAAKRSVVSLFLISLWTMIPLSPCFRSWKLSVHLLWSPRRSRETEITLSWPQLFAFAFWLQHLRFQFCFNAR